MFAVVSHIHPSLIFTRKIRGMHMGCFTNIRLGSDNHTRFKLLITTVKKFYSRCLETAETTSYGYYRNDKYIKKTFKYVLKR